MNQALIKKSPWVNNDDSVFDVTPSVPIAAWNEGNIQRAKVMAHNGTPKQQQEAREYFRHHLNENRDWDLERAIVPVAPWNTRNRQVATDLLHSSRSEDIQKGCEFFEHHLRFFRKKVKENG